MDTPPPGRAVLDTNVVLDWLVFRNPRVETLAAALHAGSLVWLSCVPMRDELVHMLASPRLARWAPDTQAVLDTHDRLARMQALPPPTRPRLRCTDPDDQVFIDLALAQQADWLWTHDRALLKLARKAAAFGLQIRKPAGP